MQKHFGSKRRAKEEILARYASFIYMGNGVMLCELSRIASHCVWLGTGGIDLGAISPFFYAFDLRENILDLFEASGGARMHPNYLRIGGLR